MVKLNRKEKMKGKCVKEEKELRVENYMSRKRCCQSPWKRLYTSREHSLIKDHISGNIHTSGGRIIATKSLLIRTITNENAWCATVREFIRPVRSKTRKALTPK